MSSPFAPTLLTSSSRSDAAIVASPPLSGEATFPRIIDATMRSSFILCRHHFFRRHCQGLTHSEGRGIHLHFGGCVARGLEVARRAYCDGKSNGDAVLAGVEAVIREWGDFEHEPHTRTEALKTLDAACLAVSDYFKMWPLDRDPLQIHREEATGPCIEFGGGREIPGCTHPETGEALVYAGRFDLIGDYNGSVWGLDDKTSSALGNTWNQKWTLRGQFTGYTWISESYGLPLAGFLVRGIQPLTNSTNFEQAISPRPPWMVQRWLEQLQRDVDEMLACWQRYKLLPEAPHSEDQFDRILDDGCFSFNRPCEFLPLCDSEHPNTWLSDYRIEHWNPLERKSEET